MENTVFKNIRETQILVNFNKRNILFGDQFSKNNLVVNFIILSTKQYIYKSLKQKKIPNISGILNHFQYNYQTEKFIALRNGRNEFFSKIWSPWNNLFTDFENP